MTSPTQSCELATEVVAAIGSLRQLVLSIQPLLDELCAQRAVHSYNRRFLEECDQVLTQLLAEHKTHTEELRLINQDINHLEDLLKNVRNSQETQKVDLTRKVSEFRFEVRGANQLIKSSEIENVDEENENLILDENELLKVPERMSKKVRANQLTRSTHFIDFPNKQVPLLEVNGHPISQSGAIVRFLAYRFALGGKDEFERARADEIYGVFFDRMREHRDYHLFRLANPGQDNEELFYSSFVPSAQKALPFYEQVVEEANEHGGFVLSSGLSYADFVVAEHVTTLFKLGPQFKDDHPNLIAFAKKIYAVSPGVERYVAQRPDTVV
ncbi:CRE-GST-13 protein [Aphelenchoides besseyi]|nr:CRE-GST-13 protein [Aphelenchoides besseyi]